MATTTYKSLGAGQLNTTANSALYTVAANTQAVVRTITLVNRNASARTVNLHIKRSGGTDRAIIALAYSLAGTGDANHGDQLEIDSPFMLSAADQIDGDASANTSVDWTITGFEVA